MGFDGLGPISVDDLEPGTICPCDFVDESGLLLIATKVEITEPLIANLRSRGVKALHPRDGVKPKRSRPKRRATTPDYTANLDSLSSSYDAAQVQRIRRQFVAGERAVEQMTEAFRRNRTVDVGETGPHVDNYVDELTEDADPVVANALTFQADLELARRCVQFSVLSLAIAKHMNVSPDEMRDLGTASLVHDWGLFNLPAESRFPHQITDPESRAAYLRHPIVSSEMLQKAEGVSALVMLYVTQVHELLDGTGFPSGLKSNQIQVGSRILAVADAYLTMTCPPTGCPRIVPCDAVAYLITAASQSKYSAAAVTGLLKTVTMYPIGSIVELSDATVARVIRSNGNDYGYPIVETLARPHRVVDLKEAELFVTRPVPVSRYNEVRLPETYTELNQALSNA